MQITIATLLWRPRDNVHDFSCGYTPIWVDRLYRAFQRNLTRPFRFVCFTDRQYEFREPIEQVVDPTLGDGGYGDCIKPYGLNEPMMLVGLDTVILGNLDHCADYCMTADKICLHRDPFNLTQAGNGVALVPAGNSHIATQHNGENDMAWLRKQPHVYADDIWPGEWRSYKCHVAPYGLGNARIVYFHGKPKMQDLLHVSWIPENWK